MREIKVKEFQKKYCGYLILLFGRPLAESTTPYTFLPKGKDLSDCTIVEYEVKEKPHDAISLGADLKQGRIVHYKGTVKAYIK